MNYLVLSLHRTTSSIYRMRVVYYIETVLQDILEMWHEETSSDRHLTRTAAHCSRTVRPCLEKMYASEVFVKELQ
jgi:hypothetical protein